MESSPIASWEGFFEALCIQFGPSAYEYLVGAFTKLVQTNSVKEYQRKFEILFKKIHGVNEDFMLVLVD